MNRRLMKKYTLLLVVLLPACGSMESPQSINRPRFVELVAEPPALRSSSDVTAVVTASVRIYDPEFRIPKFHWYIASNFRFSELDAGFSAPLTDPSRVDPALGLVYVAEGTTITVAVPPLDPALLPQDLSFDTIPIPLIVSADLGNAEIKAIKQIRFVVPELVTRVLQDEFGRAPTSAELDQAMLVRLNHNPVIANLQFAQVPSQGEYGRQALEDLKFRRALTEHPTTIAQVTALGQGLRIKPVLSDPDIALAIPQGQSGFNQLNAEVLRPEGKTYPLDLTTVDWLGVEIKDRGAFKKSSISYFAPPLQTLHYLLRDRQGGTAYAGFEVDAGAPPVPQLQGSVGSVLIAESPRMMWLNIDNTDLFNELTANIGKWLVMSVAFRSVPIPPHGVFGRVIAVTEGNQQDQSTFFEQLAKKPQLRLGSEEFSIDVTAQVVRLWAP